MEQKFNNGAMDERIVRLNEFKGVKMAQLSRGKRPAAKFNKEVANYLLDNWDDVEALKACLYAMHNDMPQGCEEVMEIYDKRVEELLAEVEPKFHEGDWITNGELLVGQVTSFDGEYYHYMCDGLEQPLHISNARKWHLWTIADAQKGDVLMHNECTFIFMGVEDGIVQAIEENMLKLTVFGEPDKDDDYQPATKEQRDTLFKAIADAGYTFDFEKKELKKTARVADSAAKELTNKRKPGAPKTRKVGDHHPTQPWIWTEYAPGKFDWRTDSALKQKPGRKAGATANQSKKKEAAGKAEKAEPAAAPKLTLTELLAKPTPQGLSKAQQNVIKSLKKGFRLRKDGNALWLTDAAGNNERTEKGVLEALQRRYKIDYIPNDIWYNG